MSPHGGIRKNRIEDQIRQSLATAIIHGVKDPLVHGLITVTKVAITPDLKLARVYVSILDTEHDHQEILRGLKRARGYLKSQIGNNIQLRHIPELDFHLDKSLDYNENIENLLKATKE